MSWLVFMPVILLLLAALAVVVWQRFRPGMGVPWLISALGSLLSWAVLLVLYLRGPLVFSITQWEPMQDVVATLLFHLDGVSWPYAFSLASLNLAITLTAGARMKTGSTPLMWAGNLSIAALGMLATLAATPLALLPVWTAMDLMELALSVSGANQPEVRQEAVIGFFIRIASSFLLAFAMLTSRAQGVILSLDSVTPVAVLYLLLAAGLRLGVLPLHAMHTLEHSAQRGLSSVLRLIGPAASLVLLARLPSATLPGNWYALIMFFAGLAAVYGSAMWAVAEDELHGRTYWIVALSGMAVACVVQGHPEASQAWGVTLLLSGGVLFLYSARAWSLSVLPALAVVGLVGFPFTPAAAGWNGLLTLPFNLTDVFFLIAMALLIMGYLRHALRPAQPWRELDRWVQTVYPIGLIVLIVSQWLIVVLVGSRLFTMGVWWGGVGALLFSLPGWLLTRTSWQGNSRLNPKRWLVAFGKQIVRFLTALFSLNWLFLLLRLIYNIVQRIVTFLTVILEGDGGVLWVFLLLALVVSILGLGGQP